MQAMKAQAQPKPWILARWRLADDSGSQPRCRGQQATYQDVLDAPATKVAEVMRGRLYLMPRPAPRHAEAGFILGGKLSEPFAGGRGGPGGWRIMAEPELHFDGSPGQNILVPDIAGWRRERLPALPDTAYFAITPDWVCEVLSPSTRRRDLGEKRDAYARKGIAHLWLVDPLARTLDAFALEKGGWRPLAQLAGNAHVCQPPFDAIRFPLADLWGP